ncbi:MAG TPA: gliding motility protein GldM [Saprospiraceae bacterium]|nr:gliding motility protein GldM [Saprospiraceae bacterium]
MSIPKEPRQLMINLMYLVLTALLALNVSAEVMNAFFSLDRGLKGSMDIVQKSNDRLKANIDKVADAYDKPENVKYKNNAAEAQRVTQEFVQYIDGVRAKLFDIAKGPSTADPSIPKDVRNKDVTTNLFINEGLGVEIENKIKETRDKLVALADNDTEVAAQLPLNIEPLPAGVKAKNWPELKFKQMPVAACFPILGKLQSDAKSSASAVLNYCAKKVSGEEEIRFDSYVPVVAANKGYLTQGETFEADVFLGAYSTQTDNIRITVNGSGLPVQQGKSHYTARAEGLGEKKLNVVISVVNPLTKDTKTYPGEFTYEVGQKSIAVQLDKMNVFYIGVENPVSVSAAGVSSNDLKVNGNGVSVASKGGGHYVITATTPSNDASLTVSAPGVSQTFKYRVKRIPDPVPMLGAKHKSKQMGNGEFKAQTFVDAVLENFDFEARCEVVGFEFTYLPKRQDPIVRTNGGKRFSGDVSEQVNKAKPGDTYFFDDIKCKCPGDAAARNIGGLAFKIK